VDDEPRALFILEIALQRLDVALDVATAANGQEAIDKFAASPFDLIVTDLRMPVMDGIELTETVNSLHLDTRVVWITACGCDRVRDVGQRLDVYGCLDKPLQIGLFREMVLEALTDCD
jgi:two-component system response regulator YesN